MIIATAYFEHRMAAESQARRAVASLGSDEESRSEEREAEHIAESVIMLRRALKSAESALKFHKKG